MEKRGRRQVVHFTAFHHFVEMGVDRQKVKEGEGGRRDNSRQKLLGKVYCSETKQHVEALQP